MCRPRHPRQRRHIHCLAFLFRNCIVYRLVVQKFSFVHIFCIYFIKHKCFSSWIALLSVLGGIDVCVGRVDCPSCRRFIIIYSTPTYNRINIKCKWEKRKSLKLNTQFYSEWASNLHRYTFNTENLIELKCSRLWITKPRDQTSLRKCMNWVNVSCKNTFLWQSRGVCSPQCRKFMIISTPAIPAYQKTSCIQNVAHDQNVQKIAL